MPRLKLSDRAIERLRPDPDGKQLLFWDTSQPGFGILVSGSTKTFVCKAKGIRKALGRVGVITLEEAREAARTMLRDLGAGVDPRIGKPTARTLGESLDGYLKAHDLAERTARGYADVMRRYFADWCPRPLSNITREMVEARHRSIAEDVEVRTRHSGKAAANSAMRVLRAIWNYAADRDSELPPNPVRLKRQWYRVAPRERTIKAGELPAFYRAVMELPSTVGRDYLLLVLFTGLRRTEAAGLRWEDVDLDARTMSIPAARTKARRRLDLPLTDFVHDLLKARLAIGRAKFIFVADSRSGHLSEPRYFLDQVAESCGVAVSVHDLRRTFVTVAESCDISAFALRALVNHAHGRDVTSGYVQLSAERLREPAQKVCDRLRQLCGVG